MFRFLREIVIKAILKLLIDFVIKAIVKYFME